MHSDAHLKILDPMQNEICGVNTDLKKIELFQNVIVIDIRERMHTS